MPTKVTILPKLGIMLAQFSGHAKSSEAVKAFENYQRHPLSSAGQKHLIDFSKVTSFEGDFTKLMELQAKLLEAVDKEEQVLFVFCAPTPLTQQMAQFSMNAWKNHGKVVTRLLDSESAAMDVIGFPGLSFDDLANETV